MDYKSNLKHSRPSSHARRQSAGRPSTTGRSGVACPFRSRERDRSRRPGGRLHAAGPWRQIRIANEHFKGRARCPHIYSWRLVSLLQHPTSSLSGHSAGVGGAGSASGRYLATAGGGGLLSTSETNGLTFDVLSDVGNVVARAFGLVWSPPEELRAALRSNNKVLPEINGDESWELPVPATYVIAPDGRVALAAVEVDYPQAPRARRDPRLSEIAKVRIIKTSPRDVSHLTASFQPSTRSPSPRDRPSEKDDDFRTINDEEAKRVLSLELSAGSLAAPQTQKCPEDEDDR